MKHSVLLLILTAFLWINGFSQAPFPSVEELDGITEKKTLVVLENDVFSGYNIYVKDAMKEYWTITPYDFISADEFEEMRKDPSYLFLVLIQTSFTRDKGDVYYNFLNLLLGKDVRNIEDMPELSSFPLSYTGVDEENYVYKTGLVVQFMQNHLRTILEDPTVTALQFLTYYNKNAPDIKGKTLLIAPGDLAPEVNSLEKIQKVYSGAVELISHEEIEKAIAEKRPGAIVLHKVGPEETSNSGRTYSVLIGCEDGKVYFYNYHLITSKAPDGFLERDFKRIGRF